MTRTILSVVFAMAWGLTSQAATSTKKYTVTFKNESTFQQVVQSFKGGAQLLSSQIAQDLSKASMHVEVLENVQVVVVEADPKALVALENNSAVASIEEEQFYPAPQPLGTFSKVPQALRSSVAIDRPWGIDAVHAPQAWNVTRGNGVRVVVIDTGLDQSHPAVSSRFVEGVNFVTLDSGDFSDQVGHGTHVAGTILADGVGGGLVGVAPEAQLFSAKVCGTLGCSSVAITKAVNWAVEKGAHVVNMSLGGPFMTMSEKKAYDAAEAAGVMIVAASGNGGKAEVSYPAAYTTTFAVGALNPDLTKADFSQWGPELDIMGPGVDVLSSVPVGSGRASEVEVDFGQGLEILKSTSFQGSAATKVNGLPLAYAGLGKPEDFQGLDFRGKVALISRGEIFFADKAKNALKAGAEGVVIFNNAPGLVQGAITDDGSELPIPVVMIEQNSGERAKALLSQGTMVTTSMGVVPADYASFQGTSMASPHVAGVAALVRAANPSLSPAQVRALLKESATSLSPNDGNKMGSGLVNAEEAVRRAQESNVLNQVAGF